MFYIPPSSKLSSTDLDDLVPQVPQLPSPLILLGDFNGHNILWDSKDINAKGRIIESFTDIRGGGRVVRWSWVNFQFRGVLLVWIRVGQGPTALAVGAGGGCLDIFTLIYPFSSLSPSLGDDPI